MIKKIRFFTKLQIRALLIILVLIILANLAGFRASFQRERNIQRVLDLGALQVGLAKYKGEFGFYPASSSDGKIVACWGPYTDYEKDNDGKRTETAFRKNKLINLADCEWGKDALLDVMDINYPAYLSVIPADPQADKGMSYLYYSNGEDYQLFASFENKEPGEYSSEIAKRKLNCGKRYCNFGRTSGVPLTEPLK